MEKENESIYFAAGVDTTCEGVDCSKYKLQPFRKKRLLRIIPAPAAASQSQAELEAKVAFENFKTDFFTTIRSLNSEGNPVGILMMQFLAGFGGDEICKLYAEHCECKPDMENPFEIWTSPTLHVPIPFQLGDVRHTATFECKMEMEITHGRCHDSRLI